MSKLQLRRNSHTPVQLAADRVYRFTPADDCTINIGPDPAGQVNHHVSYAQLRAGVTYEFVTNATDLYLSGLSRKELADVMPDELDYVNDRAKPVVPRP